MPEKYRNTSYGPAIIQASCPISSRKHTQKCRIRLSNLKSYGHCAIYVSYDSFDCFPMNVCWFRKDEEEVSNDEEVTQVKVLMTLADDELTVRKNHARNDEWIDITMRKTTKKEKKINEKWLISSKKLVNVSVSRFLTKRRKFLVVNCSPNHHKKMNHEMVPKSKDWVERLNPDSKLPNFNTGRILIPKIQAVNKPFKPTETSITLEPSKDSKAESFIPLPPRKNLQGASPSSEVMTLTFQPHSLKKRSGLGIMKHTKPKTKDSLNKSVLGIVIVSETKPTTPLVPSKVKNIEQESNINDLTKLVQMLIDENVNSTQKT
uniref:Retrovirus-related Pol polyprotein from transposon TNT 1-94 n=1 Tax=Tanacetum cinerariifolium TaxID=118510 RepID=A0A699GSE7_TANCI|nr:hypothetical protein [Tanacetum cinerariifolium]